VIALQEEVPPTPPAFLRTAGHPLRWRLLGELAHGDRTVGELCGLVGEPQNLVSYHLGKLRRAELVSSRRSSADGRDTYYRADLTHIAGQLTGTGTALHPGLRLVAPDLLASPPVSSPSRSRSPGGRVRVLYLCTGNSARSQMAEALTTERSGGAIEARSAGLRPKPLHPNAVRVMHERFGIDLSGRRSKHLSVFEHERFDYLVSLCDRAREACPDLPGRPEAIHWSMPDPSAGSGSGSGPGDDADSYPLFEQIAAEIETRVGFLVAALATDRRQRRQS
jgi:protein-tyrosine-phosphatase